MQNSRDKAGIIEWTNLGQMDDAIHPRDSYKRVSCYCPADATKST